MALQRTTIRQDQVRRYINTTAYWNAHATIIPKKGDIYIYEDAATITENGVTKNVPKFKVGDGVTSLGDLVFMGPTVYNAILTILKNSTPVGTFSANEAQDKTIDLSIPVSLDDLSDVDLDGEPANNDILVYNIKLNKFRNRALQSVALPVSTKYAASLALSVDSSTFVVTAQLKDQNGENIGSAQTIDLPLESVVVSGSYNAQTKKVVLTLQNGSTIEFSVADLVAGLQSEITAQNPLSADLVVDGNVNKVFTLTMKTKLDNIEEGAEVNVQSDWEQSDNTKDDYIKNKPTHRTINHEQITDSSLGDANLHDGFYFPNAAQDYDGNWYGAVVIGEQVWMAENLKSLHYSDGTAVPITNSNNDRYPHCNYPNADENNLEQYGLLYNWVAATRNENSAIVQDYIRGIAPGTEQNGDNIWHIPTKTEFSTLVTYLKNQNRYKANTAKASASDKLWSSGSVGTYVDKNNKTGLGLVPAGYSDHYQPGAMFNTAAYYWSSTLSTDPSSGINVRIGCFLKVAQNDTHVSVATTMMAYYKMSVRCVSDLTPYQFRNWYIKQYGSLQHHLPQEIPAQVQSDWNETHTTDPAYIKNKPPIPTVNDAVLTIQKNGTTVDTFSANASQNKTINISVPTNAADVSALPSSTKYAASLYLSVNSSTYVVTAQLKDQDGNNIGAAQTIDLPLESVVVSGSYNAQTKKVVLTLQNGSTIEFSVADLVAGLQIEITAQNPLSADLVVDGNVNKVFTLTMRNKLAGIEEGAEKNVQADWDQNDSDADDFIKHKPTHRTVNHEQITDSSLGDANLHDGFYFPNAVQDYDGNWYGAVVIGDQVWLGENLRTTHLADGTEINDGRQSGTVLNYHDYSTHPLSIEKRGLLYSYPVANSAPGAIIANWKTPTSDEYSALNTYLSNQTRYPSVVKAMAATSGWALSETENAVGNNILLNNGSGLNLYPSGSYGASGETNSGVCILWATKSSNLKTCLSLTTNHTEYTTTNYNYSSWMLAIRLVSVFTPQQFRAWYVKTYGTLQHKLDELPSLSGNSGKVLAVTEDGSGVEWKEMPLLTGGERLLINADGTYSIDLTDRSVTIINFGIGVTGANITFTLNKPGKRQVVFLSQDKTVGANIFLSCASANMLWMVGKSKLTVTAKPSFFEVIHRMAENSLSVLTATAPTEAELYGKSGSGASWEPPAE